VAQSIQRPTTDWTIGVRSPGEKKNFPLASVSKEPGSSVSMVSDYGLEDRAIAVRSPAGTKDFSSDLCVQTSSEAHTASCPMGTGGSFSRG
jgi:hypothetical protein